MAILGFLVAAAFVPFWMDPAAAPRWIVLSVGVPLALACAPRSPVTRAQAMLAGFAAVAMVSTFWAVSLWDGAWRCWQIMIALGAFRLGSALSPGDWRRAMTGFSLGIAVSAMIAVFQVSGVPVVPQGPRPGGLFWNKNMLAEAAALALVFGFRSKFSLAACVLAVPAAVGVLLAGSRGAFLAVGLMAVWAVWGWSRRAAIWLAVLGGGAGIAYAGRFAATDATFLQRIDLWSETLRHLTWAGHGAGSFAAGLRAAGAHVPDVMTFAGHAATAHNDLLTLAFEHGIFAGLPAGVAVWALWRFPGGGDDGSARLVLGCFLALGLFNFPLYDPAPLFVGALAAGYLCRDRHGDGGGDRGGRDLAPTGQPNAEHVGDGAVHRAGGGVEPVFAGDPGNGGDPAGADGPGAADAGLDPAAPGLGRRARFAVVALVVRRHAAARRRRAGGAGNAGGVGSGGAGLSANGGASPRNRKC